MAAPPKGSSGKSTGSGATPAADKKEPAKKSDAPVKPPGSTRATAGCLEWLATEPQAITTAEGTAVHRAIRERLNLSFSQRFGPSVAIRLPDAGFAHYRDTNGLEIGGKYHGQGDVDLAFRSDSQKIMYMGEIKPANWKFVDGELQLNGYVDKANANDKVKTRFNVKEFSKMSPGRFPAPPSIWVLGVQYELRWCTLGMLLYKRVKTRKQEKEEEEEKRKQQQEVKKSQSEKAYKDQVAEQRKAATEDRATNRQIEILQAKARPLEAWTPDPLRRDIETASLKTGIYRDKYQAAWPGGHVTNVVVWVKDREVQYYQEYPTAAEYWEWFAKKRGISDRQADLVRRTLADYNRDMWHLIRPDPVTQAPSSVSPFYARELLRYYYGEILRGVFLASSMIVSAGAGISSASSALRQPTPTGQRIAPSKAREEPLPDWVNQAVAKGAKGPPESVAPVVRDVTGQGAAEAVKNLERAMRVGP